jgi:hypothetical protein
MRRVQMQRRNIPHLFLINGPLPVGYTLQEDEVYYTDPSFTPGMFWKFYWALRQTDAARTVEFLLRVNASTFVDFDRLEDFVLPRLPSQKCFAGHIFDFVSEDARICTSIISGTAMIFSKDVLQQLLDIDSTNDSIQQIIHANPDDIAISLLIQLYCKNRLFELGQFFAQYENDMPLENHTERTTFYRIKNTDRMKTDIALWNQLIHSV